jgi:Rieske 2Fe-2S family protein
MDAGFEPAAQGLAVLPSFVVGGLIFASFAATAPDPAPGAAALARMTARFGWAGAAVAARHSYRIQANWKLVLENYHECYHCGPAHPEFSAVHALARPDGRRLTGRDAESWTDPEQEPYRVISSALTPGHVSGSRNGRSVAPPMGNAPFDGTCVFAELGLLSAFLAYPDYGVIYRFMPSAARETEMEVLWLVRAGAAEGRDYQEEALTWLWRVTSDADSTIIERNQAGVADRAYRPGPYSRMEPATRMFTDRYVADFRRKFSVTR